MHNRARATFRALFATGWTTGGAVTSPGTADPQLLDAWRTNNRVTIYLIERLAPELWAASLPGASRRTVGMMASHIHNARCRWIRTLGGEFGVAVPPMVDR